MTTDETLDRLVRMIAQTNIVALDKTLAAIQRSPTSYQSAASRCSSIIERLCNALQEVKRTLPKGGCKCSACVAGQTEDFDYAS